MTDITRLDGKLLQAFVVLTEERSVTKAAQRLHMTQQGMSGVLNRLRDVFEDELFVRVSQGIVPTPKSLELVPLVRTALESLNAVISSRSFDPAKSTGTINIATSDYALCAFLSPLFERFKKIAPLMQLVILPRDTENLKKNVRNGRIDLVMSLPRFLPANMHTQKLYDEEYVCLVREGDERIQQGFELDLFCDSEHLVVSNEGQEFMSTTDIALARIKRTRRIGLSIPNYGVATQIIRNTSLIGVLPRSIVRGDESGLHIFPPPIGIDGFEFVMAWPTRVAASPIHMLFRTLCAQFAHP